MDPNLWTPTSLALFLAFFVPGFLAQKVYGLIVPDEQPEAATFIVSAIAYSSLNYALASPLIWWLVARGHIGNLWVAIPAVVFILLILPTLLPLVLIWIRRRPFVQRRTLSPIKRPWDYVFNGRNSYWVIVTFKSGEKIAGIYGPHSFSSSHPRKEQIYLQKVWTLAKDGTFAAEDPKSKGVIILSDEVLTIELFSSREGDND
jgi:hypothetical protein